MRAFVVVLLLCGCGRAPEEAKVPRSEVPEVKSGEPAKGEPIAVKEPDRSKTGAPVPPKPPTKYEVIPPARLKAFVLEHAVVRVRLKSASQDFFHPENVNLSAEFEDANVGMLTLHEKMSKERFEAWLKMAPFGKWVLVQGFVLSGENHYILSACEIVTPEP